MSFLSKKKNFGQKREDTIYGRAKERIQEKIFQGETKETSEKILLFIFFGSRGFKLGDYGPGRASHEIFWHNPDMRPEKIQGELQITFTPFSTKILLTWVHSEPEFA